MIFEILHADAIANQCKELAALVTRHTDGKESNVYPTAIAPLSFTRSSTMLCPSHAVCEPILALIVQGKKEVLLGEEKYTYGAGQHLVVSVDLPLSGCVVEATPDKPYMGLKLNLDTVQLSDMVAQMNLSSAKKENSVRGLFFSNTDARLL